MPTRRAVLAGLATTTLGGCGAFPPDRSAPSTNAFTGPQVDVDLSCDAAAGELRCVADSGTTLTAENTGRVVVARPDHDDVVWVSRESVPRLPPAESVRQAFPLEPGDQLSIATPEPVGEVHVYHWSPDALRQTTFAVDEFGTMSGPDG
ncbi:hypothetical protein [Haloarchaeobius iranensis]|uniref:Lipoprotein n=1 Tax=Haloarchaeobius iranensis TaxID=996166 RepID=A0A1G9VCU2_9EURY|nr:hypothetical protein [Haloarchaeobius iranensis]SDM70088.1 hypothetical protein SAMN05192554_10646 [Haloarchaeobius iranensis]